MGVGALRRLGRRSQRHDRRCELGYIGADLHQFIHRHEPIPERAGDVDHEGAEGAEEGGELALGFGGHERNAARTATRSSSGSKPGQRVGVVLGSFSRCPSTWSAVSP